MIIKRILLPSPVPSFEFGHTYSFAPVRYRLPSSSLYLFNYLYLFPLRLPLASVARRNPGGVEASKSAGCPRKCISPPGLRGDGQPRVSNHPSGGHASASRAQPKGGEENLVCGCPAHCFPCGRQPFHLKLFVQGIPAFRETVGISEQ